MERKQGDENAEADQQQKINVTLCRSRDWVCGNRGLQFANIERSRRRRHTLIKQNKSDQQNKTAEREINRDFPRSRIAIARSPNSDEEKRWNQGELVKGVKEK